MKLTIKNMVCQRCISAVQHILTDNQIVASSITLGEVQLPHDLTTDQKNNLSARLQDVGFELIDDHNSKIVADIKRMIVGQIHHSTDTLKSSWSDYLSKELLHDYRYLSKLFSSIESITIEQYIIHQKIEKVKELLIYDELSLSQISYALDYSSVSHLSNQFKKVTGMTPTVFKKQGSRKPIDKV
ncbi:MAG: AraC family transcriptional regulator [Cyclobacteriaceae bacterium]